MQIQSIEKMSKFGYYNIQSKLTALEIAAGFLLTRKFYEQGLFFFFYYIK